MTITNSDGDYDYLCKELKYDYSSEIYDLCLMKLSGVMLRNLPNVYRT